MKGRVVDLLFPSYDNFTCGNGYMTRREFTQICSRLFGSRRVWDDLFTRVFDAQRTGSTQFELLLKGLETLLSEEESSQWVKKFEEQEDEKKEGEGAGVGVVGRAPWERLFVLWDFFLQEPVLASEATQACKEEWTKVTSTSSSGPSSSSSSSAATWKSRIIFLACLQWMGESPSGKTVGGVSLFEQQVGGHKGDAAMLQVEGCILKPLNFQEWLFYENISWLSQEHPDMCPAGLFARCEGRIRLPAAGGKKKGKNNNIAESEADAPEEGSFAEWLMLENLCLDMPHPSILDLKVGSSSMGHTKSGLVKKVKQTVVKAMSTSSTLGFRVAGMKVWHMDTQRYDEKEKKYGLHLTAKTIYDAFREYFTPYSAENTTTTTTTTVAKFRSDLAREALVRLRRIRDFIATQEWFSFNSSSLLFLYDAARGALDIRAIDFAHCYVLTGKENTTGFLTCAPSSAKSDQNKSENASRRLSLGGAALGGASSSASSSSWSEESSSGSSLTSSKGGHSKKSADLVKLEGSVDRVIGSEEQRKDETYLKGVDNIIDIIKTVLAEHEK